MKATTNNILYLFLLITDIVSFTTSGLAQVKAESIVAKPIADSIAKKVDALFSEFDKPSSPGCALAILKDGEIIYKKGYGMATLEYNIAISPSSIFHVASISKQFTAAAILRLAQEGKVSLNDDIRKYMPEVPDFGPTITFRHLLHHTSGLRDQYDLQKLAGWRSDDLITENDILDMIKQQKNLNFAPGDEFSYSNTGYTLLGMAVKKITGISLRDYADSIFFKPLGMHHTHFHNDHSEVTPNRTSAYLNQGDKWRIFLPVFDNYGATSLFTSVEDMAKWDENFYSRKVGSSDLIKSMELTGTLNNKINLIYASGLVVENYKGYKTIGHPGADAGYRSNYLRFPEQHFSIILLGNAANMNTTTLTHKVAELFLKDISSKQPPVVVQTDSTLLKNRAGTYIDYNSKSTAILYYKNGKLLKDQDILIAVNKNTFIHTKVGSTYTFKENSTRASFEVNTPGYKKSIYEKVNLLTWQSPELTEYTGEFYSPELDIRYKFLVKEGALLVKVPRNKELPCKPLVKDMFTGPFVLQYFRNNKKEIAGFKLTLGRTRNIYFQKVNQLL